MALSLRVLHMSHYILIGEVPWGKFTVYCAYGALVRLLVRKMHGWAILAVDDQAHLAYHLCSFGS